MNTGNFLIEEKDLDLAKSICKFIENDTVRNRALANSVAAEIAKKYFTDINKTIDSESGLHNISSILEQMDIADLYIDNNYIDVRVFFNDNELAVPKSHFDNDLLPAAYMFIKLSSDLSGASVEGFILPENIDTTSDVDGYYVVDYASLVSYYDIEIALVSKDDTYSIDDEQIFAFIDGSVENKNEFLQELLQSQDARLRLAKALKAKSVFNFVSIVKDEDVLSENEEVLADSNELEFDNLLEDNDNFDLLEESSDNNEDFDINLQEEENVLELNEDFPTLELGDNIDSLEEFDSEIDNSIVEMISNETVSNELLEDENDDNQEISMTLNDSTESVGTIYGELQEDEESTGMPLILEEDIDTSIDSEISEINEGSQILVDGEISEDLEENVVLEDNFDMDLEQNNEIEEDLEEEHSISELDENMLNTDESITDNDLDMVLDESEDDILEQYEDSQQTMDNALEEEVDSLFGNDEENVSYEPQRTSSGIAVILAIVALLAVIGGAGYWGYNKYISNITTDADVVPKQDIPNAIETPAVAKKIDAMPIESVEVPVIDSASKNLGVTETIPAIEQSLDASILVSNLKVDWEVPAGYTTNAAAKRYLIKLGKIIQLNLKSELLLLSKPPITNVITVEISYNSSSRKFETVGIVKSSGEKSVDDLILTTVRQALGMHLNMNSDSFSGLKGNPVLVIRL